MDLLNVSIYNFGSIKEEQNIKICDGITALIGLNESGKSTILSAISKLNGEGIRDDEKNRHSDYKTKDSEITGEFTLNDNDLNRIEKDNPLMKLARNHFWSFKVSIKNDKDTKYFSFNCDKNYFNMDAEIKKNLLSVVDENAKELEIDLSDLISNLSDSLDLEKDFKTIIAPYQEKNVKLYNKLMNYWKYLNWLNYLPEYKIIKFDNNSILGDSIEITKIPANLQANNFFKISNCSIDNLIEQPSSISAMEKADIEENCQVKISQKFNNIFRQNDENLKFKVRIDDKNNKVDFFVVDSTSDNNSIPLSKRSDGFNWYFSIYLTLYEYLNNENDIKYILLFDEPNLYLNPSAQIDLLNRVFKEEFKGHQIVYSTHSPYMIDTSDFKSIRIIEKKTETTVFNNIPEYYKENKIRNNEVDLLTPVLTSLQLSVSNSIIIDKDCMAVLVEGLEDHYLLNAMIKKIGYENNMNNYKIIPCIGVDKAPMLYSYLYGLGYAIIVLFDGDSQGKNVIKRLKKDLKGMDNLINMLLTYSIVFDEKKDTKLEDLLFGDDSKFVEHDKTLTYRDFFNNVDNLKLSKETTNNFKKLFDKLLKFKTS